jgi:hypothetical protein
MVLTTVAFVVCTILPLSKLLPAFSGFWLLGANTGWLSTPEAEPCRAETSAIKGNQKEVS